MEHLIEEIAWLQDKIFLILEVRPKITKVSTLNCRLQNRDKDHVEWTNRIQ